MEKRLYRSKNDQKIAGVCGGIAEYFSIDSTLIRLIWIIMSLAYGTGIMAYIIAIIVIPEREGSATVNLKKNSDNTYSSESRSFYSNEDKERDRKILGYILVATGSLLLFKRIFPLYLINFKFLAPAILIGLGLFFIGKGWRE